MKPAPSILLASAVSTLILAMARAEPADPGRWPEAWRLSRGEGVTVAVVATETRLADAIRARAPWASVLHVEPQPERRTRKRAEDRDDEGVALAAAIDAALELKARVILVAAALRGRESRVVESLRKAREKGALVVAPAGDEGLSIERFPASEPGVVGVAALASGSALAAGTNAGARTALAAPGATSFDAAAEAAAAAVLAFAFDPSLGPADVARALTAGPIASRATPRGGEPSRLDVPLLLDTLRPRSRSAIVRDARVLPVHVPSGAPARLAFTVRAVGRLPARGPIAVEGGGTRLLVPFASLAPGESRELEVEVLLRAGGPSAALRTADGGVLAASPASLVLRVERDFATVACDLVPPHQRPRSLRLVRVAVRQGLALAATIENAGLDAEEGAEARLVAPGGRVLGRAALPSLASGERRTVELEGTSPPPEDTPSVLRAVLEVARRPAGFREDGRGALAARARRGALAGEAERHSTLTDLTACLLCGEATSDARPERDRFEPPFWDRLPPPRSRPRDSVRRRR
jgi:hypothetical protein